MCFIMASTAHIPPPQHNLLVSNRIVMFLILHFYSCIKILKCELQLNSHSALSIISLVLILSKPSYWCNITLDTGCHKGIKPPNSNKVYFTGERAAVQKNIMLLQLLISVEGGGERKAFDSLNYCLQVSTSTHFNLTKQVIYLLSESTHVQGNASALQG